MAKFSLCIFTVAVLLGGIAAQLLCVRTGIYRISPSLFITWPHKACRDLDTKFDPTRQEFKKCLGIEVNINKVEYLHREFCNPNSDYRQKVDRQRRCIAINLTKSMNCSLNMRNYQSLQRGNIPTRSLYDTCKSLSVEISKCSTEKVGGPCGAEGLEVYGRIAEASESFFTASCFSVAKLAAGDDLVDEIEEAEHEVVEASHSGQYKVAAATSHSALIWCILVELLLAARWW